MPGQQKNTKQIDLEAGPAMAEGEAPVQWFCYAFALFVAIQYPISAAALTTISYYVFLLPSLIYLVYIERKALIHRLLSSSSFKVFSLFFLFIAVHALLFSAYHTETLKTVQHTMLTYIFFVCAVLFFHRSSVAFLYRCMYVLGMLGGVSAVISIGIFYGGGYVENPRLVPVGRAEHEILGSFVYTIAGLCALFSLNRSYTLLSRVMLFTSVVVIGVMVLLTQSRMAMGAYGLSVGIGTWILLLKSYSWKNVVLVTLVAGIALVIVVFLVTPLREWLHQFLHALASRGDSFRLALWSLAIDGIKAHPWIGNGMQASVTHPQSQSPHSIYLGTAFHIGIPGLVLFIVALISAVKTLLQLVEDTLPLVFAPLIALFLLCGLLSGVTEYSQMVKSPHPMWLIFWLPIAAIIGLSCNESVKQEARAAKTKEC